MNKLFLYLGACFPLTASVISISSDQQTNEYGTDCMGQRRPGINIHDLLYEDDQIRNLSYPTHCCDDYYIRFTHSSIPTLATSSFGTRPSYIVDINMRNANISKILPGTFTGLNYLNCLDLSQNNISIIQPGLFNNLTRLFILNLANNNIKQIFDNAFDNTNLRKIFLQDNMISFLGDNLLSSLKNSLTLINLSKNILKDINNTFVGMNSLVSLNLNHNNIQNVNLANIYSTEIYLRNNKISYIGAVRNMLQTVDLSENNIQSIENLGSGFINSSITKLYLSRNAIQLNKNSLVGLHHLTHLYLDNNKVGNISNMVFKDLKSLISLDISHNDISQLQYGTFDHMSNIQYLNISCNKFTEPQLHKISHILALTKKIRIIDLSENNIQSIEDLGTGFINSSIEKLYLSRNAIQLNQNSLAGLYSLTHLYLDNNNVKNISKMNFQDLNSLIFLDISHNDIAQLLYDTFDHLCNMQYLNISFNKLAVLQLLVFNPLHKLIELDFGNNQITELDIESFLYQCSTLRKINVDGNLWKCKTLTNIINYCQTENVEVVWGNSVDFESVRGIACDGDDFAINNNTTKNNGTEKNVNENNGTEKNVNDNNGTEKNVNDNNVNENNTTEKNVNKNNGIEKNVNENNGTEKSVNRNNFDLRLLENSSFLNFLKKDFGKNNFFDYLQNVHSREPTDTINLNSTSLYNFSNYKQSNIFKYLDNLRIPNHEISEPHVHFIFDVLLVFILVLILIVVVIILILLLKKRSNKSTRNTSHQDNVELL